MTDPAAAPHRLVPRQKVGSPLMIALACFMSASAGRALSEGDWSWFAMCLAGAVAVSIIGLAFALMQPDEQELREVRAAYDKKIARLESRRP